MRAYRDRQRTLEQLSRHVATWIDELEAFELKRRVPLGPFAAVAPDGRRTRLDRGDAWPDRIGIHRFVSESPVTVPAEAGVELRLDFGGETLVRLKGADGRVLKSFAANPCHRRFDVPRDVPFTIEAEAAARGLFGVPNRTPRIETAEILHFHPEIRALGRLLAWCATPRRASPTRNSPAPCTRAPKSPSPNSACRPPPPKSAPASPAGHGARHLGAQLRADRRARAAPRRGARERGRGARPPHRARRHAAHRLSEAGPRPGDRPRPHRLCVAVAAAETVRKIVRTFNSVSTLLDAYPDFRFLQSSALYYRHVEEEDPALFADIARHVAAGRWEAIGGMWVECDTNMPSAEAFLRQFLLGQTYLRDRFGVTSRVAWLPDTFGFTGAMPQILRHAGIEALVTIKVSWNETNRLEDNLFRWQGNDGSRVLVHTFDAYDNDGYNMLMTPAALCEVWQKHAAKDLVPSVIASYGWGDGGGGPDPDQIEALPLLNLMPAIPTVEHGAIEPHVLSLARELENAAVPVWQGELYLEYHRATLTTQGRTKQLNRRAEAALVAAEAVSVIDALAGGDANPPDLAEDWALLLRNQFHDILPGSSVREVYEQTEPELAGIVARADAVVAARLAAIAAGARARRKASSSPTSPARRSARCRSRARQR